MDRFAAAQSVVFLALVVGFVVVEWRWPGRLLVSRRADWKRDAIGFVVVSVAAGASQAGLTQLGHGLALDDLGLDALAALPGALRVAAAFALVDLGIYWIHRAMHASNALWRTHRWHHSTEHLYWLSGMRTSALHALLYAVPQVGVVVFVLHLRPAEVFATGVLGGFSQLYIHSSTDVGLGPLGWLFVTPRMHRLHHARGETQGKNLGTFLTIWDRMFGTYVDPASVPAPTAVGIDEKPSLVRMLVGL